MQIVPKILLGAVVVLSCRGMLRHKIRTEEKSILFQRICVVICLNDKSDAIVW